MRNFVSRTALVALLTLAASATFLGEVKVLLTANKIVSVNGVEQKQSSEKAKPGDVIEYVADYKNTDKLPVKNVQATLPIPNGMEFIPQTADPAKVMASTDDVNYAPVPLKRKVKGADGKILEELVPYSQYRSLRWELGEIGGGLTKSVRARMRVKTAQSNK